MPECAKAHLQQSSITIFLWGGPQTREGEGKEETGKDWFEEGETKGECKGWRKGNYVGEGGVL